MPISKPFVIATEGPTIDGRNISRQWIADMAKTYDPKTYTAVANLEHFLSSLPDGIFKSYGKVVSLGTQEATILGEKKLQLTAIVDASQDIVDLQKKGQKAFASIEVLNNFIGKGVTYLSGLAFTDQPASLGTEAMKFSHGGAAGERFAVKDEISIEFEAENKPTAGESLFNKVKDLLGLGKKQADEQFADQAKAIETIAGSQKALLDQFAAAGEKVDAAATQFKAAQGELAALKQQFADLSKKLGSTDGDGSQRPPATGSDGQIKTDC